MYDYQNQYDSIYITCIFVPSVVGWSRCHQRSWGGIGEGDQSRPFENLWDILLYRKYDWDAVFRNIAVHKSILYVPIHSKFSNIFWRFRHSLHVLWLLVWYLWWIAVLLLFCWMKQDRSAFEREMTGRHADCVALTCWFAVSLADCLPITSLFQAMWAVEVDR